MVERSGQARIAPKPQWLIEHPKRRVPINPRRAGQARDGPRRTTRDRSLAAGGATPALRSFLCALCVLCDSIRTFATPSWRERGPSRSHVPRGNAQRALPLPPGEDQGEGDLKRRTGLVTTDLSGQEDWNPLSLYEGARGFSLVPTLRVGTHKPRAAEYFPLITEARAPTAGCAAHPTALVILKPIS